LEKDLKIVKDVLSSWIGILKIIMPSALYFCKIYLFILERLRGGVERARCRRAEAEGRESQGDSMLSMEPNARLNSMTLRS